MELKELSSGRPREVKGKKILECDTGCTSWMCNYWTASLKGTRSAGLGAVGVVSNMNNKPGY